MAHGYHPHRSLPTRAFPEEFARAMLSIGGGFAAQIEVRRGEYPFMRQLVLMLYPAQDGEPEEERVLTDIRPREDWR